MINFLTCSGMKTANSVVTTDSGHGTQLAFCNDVEDDHEDHDDHDDHEEEHDDHEEEHDDHSDSDSDTFLLTFGCVLGMLIAGIVACMC